MDSKEETYRRYHTYAEFDLIPNKESCLGAMEEHARQVAIDFTEWIKDNNYTKSDKGWYQYHVQIESKYNFSFSQTVYNFITIEEIFKLYLQSKK